MTNELTSEVELAEKFGIQPQQAAEMRQKQKWPHVRLSRFEVRYTEDQIAQIIAARSVSGSTAASKSGLTKRSAGAA